ncbi:hypothetical protein [Burkholderia anthina]|uniref:hypothetical protein n=1 Tax=Burkholderia anthina TaxID=179879 RepID=UPI000B1F56CE|nr:hypothetical protein [Burkholderia anthina]
MSFLPFQMTGQHQKCGAASIFVAPDLGQYKKLLIKISELRRHQKTTFCCAAENNQSPYAG